MRETLSISWSLSMKGRPSALRHLAADRRLAGAHQADEDDRAAPSRRSSSAACLSGGDCLNAVIAMPSLRRVST